MHNHHLGPNCINSEVLIQNLTVTGEDLSNNSVDASQKLKTLPLLVINMVYYNKWNTYCPNSVDANKIKNVDITSTQLGDQCVITSKLANNNVTGENY